MFFLVLLLFNALTISVHAAPAEKYLKEFNSDIKTFKSKKSSSTENCDSEGSKSDLTKKAIKVLVCIAAGAAVLIGGTQLLSNSAFFQKKTGVDAEPTRLATKDDTRSHFHPSNQRRFRASNALDRLTSMFSSATGEAEEEKLECCICLEEFKSNELHSYFSCRHKLCSTCGPTHISSSSNPTCPECRCSVLSH